MRVLVERQAVWAPCQNAAGADSQHRRGLQACWFRCGRASQSTDRSLHCSIASASHWRDYARWLLACEVIGELVFEKIFVKIRKTWNSSADAKRLPASASSDI